MLVAGTLGFSAPDEILLVNLAASRILVADALDGQFEMCIRDSNKTVIGLEDVKTFFSKAVIKFIIV